MHKNISYIYHKNKKSMIIGTKICNKILLKKIHFVCVFLFINTLHGCTVMKDVGNKAMAIIQCSIELDNIQKYISFKENSPNLFNYVIEINFIGKNPTQYNISLGRYRFDLYANGKYLSSYDTQTPIQFNAQTHTPIQTKLLIAPGTTIGVLLKKLFDVPIEFKIKGTFYLKIGNFTMPIERELIKFVEN